MGRELLFSVTAKDCEWDYIRGSGKGGQKRNKTSSAVRCRHVASGAVGYSEDTRSQSQNKVIAFRRMAASKEFCIWHRMEVARKNGTLVAAKEAAKRQMTLSNLKIEERRDGRWEEVGDDG